MSVQIHSSTAFAQSLKTYGNITYYPSVGRKETITAVAVVKFNTKSFQDKCNPASVNYDPSIVFDLVATELFKIGEIWSSRDGLLLPAIEELAKLHGFNITKVKTSICCNRMGKIKWKRNYIGGELAAECPFAVKVKALSKSAYKVLPTSIKWNYRYNWTLPVEIMSACCEHGENCVPGGQNRLMTGKRAGKYIEKMPDEALFSLCHMLEKNGSIKTNTIINEMRPVWPIKKMSPNTIVSIYEGKY